MLNVPLSLFVVALIILLGFATARLFQMTRVPDVPLLLSIGLLLGPLNRAALEAGYGSEFVAANIQVDELQQVAPFISTLALIIILFDSGLKLNFVHLYKSVRPAFLHTLPLFILTVSGVALVAHFVLGMPALVATVLGVALSNVGQTVSAATIRDLKLDPDVRSIYFVEMALYDLISIPLIVSLLEFLQGQGGVDDFGLFFQGLARVLSVSLLFGIVGGLIWIYFLLRLEDYPFTYMVTLATLLLVYSVNSFAGGSGPVSVLIFGLVIGNRDLILRTIRARGLEVVEGEKVHSFHDEITFFVRAFFFVFLGITFTTGRPGEWVAATTLWPFSRYNNTATLFLVGVGLIFVLIVFLRFFVVRAISARGAPHRRGLFPVFGRGLGTAVLATFPFTLAAYENPDSYYHQVLNPWQAVFVNTALLVILLTVTGTAITVWFHENRAARIAALKGTKPASAKE